MSLHCRHTGGVAGTDAKQVSGMKILVSHPYYQDHQHFGRAELVYMSFSFKKTSGVISRSAVARNYYVTADIFEAVFMSRHCQLCSRLEDSFILAIDNAPVH